MLTYASTNDQWARTACPLFTSPENKPGHFIIQLRRSARALKSDLSVSNCPQHARLNELKREVRHTNCEIFHNAVYSDFFRNCNVHSIYFLP